MQISNIFLKILLNTVYSYSKGGMEDRLRISSRFRNGSHQYKMIKYYETNYY